MKNIYTRLPMKGDIVILDGEKKEHFIKANSFELASLPQGAEALGVVVDRMGKEVMIVHKNQPSDMKWSNGYYWKVTGWQLDGSPHTCSVSFYESQVQPSNPTFTYTATRIIEVVASLLRWFNAYFAESNIRYNVYALDDKTIKVVKESYDNWYEYTLNISGVSVAYDTGTELPSTTNAYAINGKGGYYKGMNWDKFVEYMRTTTSGSFNPSEVVDSLPTNPVSLPSYLGTTEKGDMCAYLRGIYGEGEQGWLKFLAGYMVKYPTMRGIFGEDYKDGYKNTYLLADKTFNKTDGSAEVSYPPFHYCANLGYDNPNFAKGRWYLPTMDDLQRLVEGIKLDYTDIINTSLKAIGGKQITFRGVWSCCRYNVADAWDFYGWAGYARYYSFYGRLGVVAFLLYHLNECED